MESWNRAASGIVRGGKAFGHLVGGIHRPILLVSGPQLWSRVTVGGIHIQLSEVKFSDLIKETNDGKIICQGVFH